MIQSVNSIPPLDLRQQYASIEAEVSAAVLGVLASGRYIGGPIVEGFEQQLAAFVGASDCVACNSGTDALYLALRALDIGPGDEVITTPFSFFSTAGVISAVGATPVFVDIDVDTFNIDLKQVAAAITRKTKAMIPVHLFGQPVDMSQLMAIAQPHHLAVIEDCAQAIGAEWAGQRVGSIGHVGCFSFYPTKNLGACGDGGAMTTNDPTIAARIRRLQNHGQNKARYYHEEIGVNSRLDAIQAAILQIKLRHLDLWNDQRRAIALRYNHLLNHIPGIVTPQISGKGQGIWHQYTIRLMQTANFKNGGSHYRDQVRQMLQERGVSSMVYYPQPLHLQPVYESLGYQLGHLPVVEQVCHEVLSLPMFPELSIEQQEKVVYDLKDCLVEIGHGA